MQRTLATILGLAGLAIAAMGLVISSSDGAAMKFGAIIGGIVLAIVGFALYKSTIKPEKFTSARDYKERGPLILGEDGVARSATSKSSGGSGSGSDEPKPKKSKTYEL